MVCVPSREHEVDGGLIGPVLEGRGGTAGEVPGNGELGIRRCHCYAANWDGQTYSKIYAKETRKVDKEIRSSGVVTSPESSTDGGGTSEFGDKIEQPWGTIWPGRRGEMERTEWGLSRNKPLVKWWLKSLEIKWR
jgi:hypothetical protein